MDSTETLAVLEPVTLSCDSLQQNPMFPMFPHLSQFCLLWNLPHTDHTERPHLFQLQRGALWDDDAVTCAVLFFVRCISCDCCFPGYDPLRVQHCWLTHVEEHDQEISETALQQRLSLQLRLRPWDFYEDALPFFSSSVATKQPSWDWDLTANENKELTSCVGRRLQTEMHSKEQLNLPRYRQSN